MDYVENEVNGRKMRQGFSLHTHDSHSLGETVLTVCDAIGVVFSTIYEQDPMLEKFYEPLAQESP